MQNLDIFAFRVKKLRKQRKLSQKELGEAIGLTAKSICTIESGFRVTTIEKLILLAQFFEVSTDYPRYFGVSADYLLGLKDEP